MMTVNGCGDFRHFNGHRRIRSNNLSEMAQSLDWRRLVGARSLRWVSVSNPPRSEADTPRMTSLFDASLTPVFIETALVYFPLRARYTIIHDIEHGRRTEA